MRTLKNFEKKQRGTSSFPCALYRVDKDHPSYEMPFHWHTEYEIIVVREGEIELAVNDRSEILRKGDVLFLSDGTLHGGAPKGDGTVYDCIVFDGGIVTKNSTAGEIREIFRHGRTVRSFMSLADYPEISLCARNLADALIDAETEISGGGEIICLGLILQFFGNVIRYGCCENGYTETNRHISRLKNALAYMEEHYPEKVTLEDLAEAAGVTPKYLCRSFCSLTGKTPISYLNEYRIDCACELLRTTDDSMLEIAGLCGFSDQSYFVRLFKRQKGITPGQYRSNALS